MADELPVYQDPWVGKTLAGYLILKRIGIGGMGTIYLGHHQSLDRMAAIKFLAVHLLNDSSYIELFLREARAAAKLNHHNLVDVYDAGSTGPDCYYFIMEYVEGRDLNLIQKDIGVFAPEQAVEYVRQVAVALDYAHRKGIIHRDVKPENLLLTNEGVIKVADMGLAKWIGEDSAMTQGGWVMGSPYYISPERLKDQKNVDARADIYSLGATLYHLLTGRVPYEGTPPVVMAQHLDAPLPNPLEANSDLDFDICDIIQRMMAKDPADRYQTMEEVARAMTDYLSAEDHPHHASPTQVIAQVPPQEEAEEEPVASEKRRAGGPLILVRVAMLLAVLGAGAWWLMASQVQIQKKASAALDAQVKLPKEIVIVPDEEGPDRLAAPDIRKIQPPSTIVTEPSVDQTKLTPPPAPKTVAPEAPAGLQTFFASPQGKEEAAGTLNDPLTLAGALAKVRPGGEVVVLAGTYRGGIFLPRSGDEANPIRLTADGKVVFDAGGDAQKNPFGILGRRAGGWIISGFECKGFLQGIKLADAQDIIVRNCKLYGGGTGLSLEGNQASRIVIEDVEVFDNREDGFDISKGVAVDDVVFRRCVAHNNHCNSGGDAFGLSHGCSAKNLRYENCEAYENGSEGFDIGNGSGESVVLTGCISHHNGQRVWGANFKAWREGIKFINCTAWVTGKDSDGNFELRGDKQLLLNCTSGENADSGVVVGGTDVQIINCIIASSTKHAVRIKKDKNSKASCNVENTLLYECPGPGAVPLGKNKNFSANPKFIDARKGNYGIRHGSPATGKGQPHPELKTDANGRPRPADHPAVGAYEPAS
jgi:protein kinase-like protein/parallel beta helix pectate lyase-like protein